MARLQHGTTKLTRTADEIRHYRTYKKVVPAIMGAIAVLIALVYVVSVMYTKFGSFTVSVNKYHELQYGLSLSEKADFNKPTSRLDCKASELITNIDGKTLDQYPIGAIDGADSGENYLCYTFYCKNTGQDAVSFEYSILITNMTMDIEKAVRVRLMTNYNGENGTKTDYAWPKGVDENNNTIPEVNTTPFFDKNTVMRQTVEDFKPKDYMKYTVVIWLEGPDEDCVDKIIGGEFKIDMKFSIVAVGGTLIEEL